jgi:predicted PurR-regulated permease PerM
MKTNETSVFDISIRLVILFIVVAWCLLILFPFVYIMLWALIFAIAFFPIHGKIAKRMGNNRKLASVVIVFSCLVVLVVPSILFLDSIVEGVVQLRESYQAGSLTIPPPSVLIHKKVNYILSGCPV